MSSANLHLKCWASLLIILLSLQGCRSSTNNNSANSEPIAVPAGFKEISQQWSGANLNTLLWEDGGWSDVQAFEATQALGVSLIRYPGGTVSDYFDWRTGGTVDRCRFRTLDSDGCRSWDSIDLPNRAPFNAFTDYAGGTLSNLQTMLTETNTNAMFTLNMITDSYEGNLTLLETAQDMGFAVGYVQLGNEHYFADENYMAMFSDGASYGALAKDWITRLQLRFPDARFVVTGYVPDFDPKTGDYSHADNSAYINRVITWNQEVVSSGVLEVADAVSLHVYARPSGDLIDSKFSNTVVSEVLGHASDYLDQYFQRPEYLALPDNTRIWFTEFNINGSLAPGIVRSWVHGLYIGLLTTELLLHPDVDRLVTHMLMGSGIWQNVFHPGGYAGANLVPGATPYALTAIGTVLQQFFQVSPAQNFILPVTSEALAASEELAPSSVDPRLAKGILFSDRSLDQQTLVFINGTAETLTVNPSRIGTNWTEATAIHAPPGEQILGPQSLASETLAVNEAMNLPAYSITVFR